MATALEREGGAASANVALRVFDAIDPPVEVSAITTVDAVIEKLQAGEDPTWLELRAVFGKAQPSAPVADALPAQTG